MGEDGLVGEVVVADELFEVGMAKAIRRDTRGTLDGEQWIFTYDRQPKAASLHGGDVGWNTRLKVLDGGVQGLVLQTEEAEWLHACWNAAVGQVAK